MASSFPTDTRAQERPAADEACWPRADHDKRACGRSSQNGFGHPIMPEYKLRSNQAKAKGPVGKYLKLIKRIPFNPSAVGSAFQPFLSQGIEPRLRFAHL